MTQENGDRAAQRGLVVVSSSCSVPTCEEVPSVCQVQHFNTRVAGRGGLQASGESRGFVSLNSSRLADLIPRALQGGPPEETEYRCVPRDSNSRYQPSCFV